MSKYTYIVAAALSLSACVSKKKYVALETQHNQTKSNLQQTLLEKEALEGKFAKIQKRANAYNEKINALAAENETKLDVIEGKLVISEAQKKKMRTALANMDTSGLTSATTLNDSINYVVSNNLKKSIQDQHIESTDEIDIKVDETVVMISISDKLLFRSGSYSVSPKANKVLHQIADVINSEPSIEVLVEGHTDDRTIQTPVLQDNWDLSVKRATSIVRLLQKKYEVAPGKLIAAGRSCYAPVAENNSAANRSLNRRTKISIIPKINKFFALLAAE